MVENKKGASIALQHVGGLRDDLTNQGAEIQGVVNRRGDIQHDRHLAVVSHHLAVEIEVLDRHRRLMGKRPQQPFVFFVEDPDALVDDLHDTENLVSETPHRRAQNGSGAVAGLLVHRRIETLICVGVRDIEDGFVVGHPTDNSRPGRHPDLFHLRPLRHLGPQIAGGRVDQEQRGPVGVGNVAGGAHQPVDETFDTGTELGRVRQVEELIEMLERALRRLQTILVVLVKLVGAT